MLVTGWSGNTGTLGIFLAMGSFFLLRYRIKRIPFLFIFAIILIAMTKSITAMVAFGAGGLLYFKNKKAVLISLILVLVVFIGFFKPIRMNRIVIWSQIVELVKTRPFIGHGIGKLAELGVKDGVIPVTMAHNDFLEVILDIGIVGFVLFMGFIIERLLFFMRQKNNVMQLAMISSLIVYLVSSLFWFSMHLAQLSFYAIIIWACLEYSYENQEE